MGCEPGFCLSEIAPPFGRPASMRRAGLGVQSPAALGPLLQSVVRNRAAGVRAGRGRLPGWLDH